MIRSFRLGNFKAFAETQEIPLRPITLVFGPNSAGKSSIIHSLALAHNAITAGDLEAYRTEIGGESIDLGGFRQYVFRRDVTKQVEWAAELDTAGLTGRLGELLAPARTVALQVSIGLRGDADARVVACSILADGKPILTMSRRAGNRLRIDRLDREHPVFREVLKAVALSATFTQELRDEDVEGLAEAVDEIVPEIPVHLTSFFPRVEGPVSAQTETMQSLLFSGAGQSVLFSGAGDRPEQQRRAVELFLPRAVRDIVNGLAETVEAAIGRLKYLGPLRSYPPRHLAFSIHHDTNWHAGGGAAWDVLRRDAHVREKVNDWLGSDFLKTPYGIVAREFVDMDDVESVVRDALDGAPLRDWSYEGATDDYVEAVPLESWGPEYVEFKIEQIKTSLSESNAARISDLVLVDNRTFTTVSHKDVGIGVSQVMPVLVSAYAYRDQLVAIEQPEIHLHPRLQAELADLFIESALGERRNTFILETHSEHLILRILRRIRETTEGTLPSGILPIHPEDVAVLYVEPAPKARVSDVPRAEGLDRNESGSSAPVLYEPSSKGSTVLLIPVTEDGDFAGSWPDGFFDDRMRELI